MNLFFNQKTAQQTPHKIVSLLLPYQKEDLREIHRRNGRILIANEMGTGKTVEALSWLATSTNTKPAIIICPSILKLNWQREIRKFLGEHSVILEGKKPVPLSRIRENSLIIINYDILQYWLDCLKNIRPQTVIIDECHYCKNRQAKRTKAVKELCRNVPHILALGGTPIVNRPAELFPILNTIWPKEFSSFWTFAFRYCAPKKNRWGWDFTGASNLSELHSKLSAHGMIRRRKQDVLSQLPEKTREIVEIELETKHKNEYKEAENNFIQWVRRYNIENDKDYKMNALVKVGVLKRLAAELKINQFMEWLDSFLESSDGKIIVFAIHKKIIDTLKNKYNHKCVVIDGSVPPQQRAINADKFNKNKSTRIMIAQIQAAGVGWNGTAASDVAMLEISWSPAMNIQAEDRAHRIGQTKNVTCWYFVASQTIEERILKAIEMKESVIKSVIDGDMVDHSQVIRRVINEYRQGK